MYRDADPCNRRPNMTAGITRATAPLPTHHCAVPPRRVASRLSLLYWKWIGAYCALVCKHINQIESCRSAVLV